MLFSVHDIALLRLLRWCGCIAPSALNGLFQDTEVKNLTAAGLIRKHRESGSLTLTEKGHKCLETARVVCPERIPFSYREDLLQRRIRTSHFVLTAYRAQADPFTTALNELSKNPALFLPVINRGRTRNLWGSSRVAALVRMGNLYCGAYSVYSGVGKINLEDERKTVSNCAGNLKGVQTAFLFAGESYAAVLSELERKDETAEGRLLSYGEAWRRSPLSVHLVACNEVGAVQLRLMAQPDYRRRLAQAGLGQNYIPAPPELPHCDGMLRGVPFVIAADMDLHRLDAAYLEAKQAGFETIAAAALKGQIEGALRMRYRGKVKLFTITDETLASAFGDTLPLRSPEHGPYLDAEGGVLDVPLIQSYRKAGGSS